MNDLVLIREKINKARRLNQAKLLATKNGEVTPYKISVYMKRIKQSQKDLKLQDS
tara:strand:+ start:182 stop:346 length:165 start_codon:yes stop_codon:yes gene_type:complete